MIPFKTRLFSLVCAGVCGASLFSHARADTPAQNAARREIAATYAKLTNAIKHKDLATVASIEAPDYQGVSLVGITRNRERDLAAMQMVFRMGASYSKYDDKIVSLKWRGPDAIVICKSTVVAVAQRGTRQGRSGGFVVTRDYWSKGAGGWQIRQSVERSGEMWLNGQRVF